MTIEEQIAALQVDAGAAETAMMHRLLRWLAMTAPWTMSGTFALMLLELEMSHARINALVGKPREKRDA